jgi:hypothetical protein
MLARKDRSSSTYQMWIHQLFCGGGGQLAMHTGDPAIDDNAGTDIHHNFYFLPWHRAFLFFHERLLQQSLGEDFRLFVYDWENPGGQDLPRYYAQLPVIGSQCHPLRYGDGSSSMPAVTHCQVQAWLIDDSMDKFAGGRVRADSIGAASGPHGYIHSYLGNLMGGMDTAAADPVFWAHHANVDRYWDHWARKYSGTDAYRSYWPKGNFYFYDCGKLVYISMDYLMHAASLGYSNAPSPIDLTSHETLPFDLPNPSLSELAPVYAEVLTALSVSAESIAARLPAPLRPPLRSYLDVFSHANPMAALRSPLAAVQALLPGDVVRSLLNAYLDIPLKANLSFSLPARIVGSTAAGGLQPGCYYLVAVQDQSISGGDGLGIVGGFAVLHGHHHAERMIATSCITPLALQLIARATLAGRPLRLVYGQSTSTADQFADVGSVQPFTNIECAVHLPRVPADLLM